MRTNNQHRTTTSDLGSYGIVQRRVLGMVSCTAFAVYAALTTYADRDTMSCFPSIKTLAKDLAKSDSTIQRALIDLEDKGIITVERRKRPDGSNYPNLYHVHIVPEPEIEEEQEDDEAGGMVAHLRPRGVMDDRITVPKNCTKGLAKCQGEGGVQTQSENQSPTSYTVNLGDGEVVKVFDPKQARTRRTRARKGKGLYRTLSKTWLSDGRLVIHSKVKKVQNQDKENLDQDTGRTSIPHTPTTFNDGWCAAA